jgi:hypothetical protein
MVLPQGSPCCLVPAASFLRMKFWICKPRRPLWTLQRVLSVPLMAWLQVVQARIVKDFAVLEPESFTVRVVKAFG